MDSVNSVLKQRLDNLNIEIIISDNASEDDTFKIIKSITDKRIKYIRHSKNIGLQQNWAKAIFKFSKGKYLLILSDDDYLTNVDYLNNAYKLCESYKLFLCHANHKAVSSNFEKRYIKQLPQIMHGDLFIDRFMKNRDYTLNLTTVLFRKSGVEGIDITDRSIFSIDFLMFLAGMKRKQIGYIDEEVSVYRLHDRNVSSAGIIAWFKNARYLKILLDKDILTSLQYTKLTLRYIRTRVLPRLVKLFF